MLSTILQLAGAAFEVIGVVYMANLYINVDGFDKVKVLLSGLYRGESAELAARAFKNTIESPRRILKSIQGLSLIASGFILQAAGGIVSLLERSAN